MIQDLFKTPVYKTTLSLDKKTLTSYCLSMAKKDKGRIVSNEGGWQSNDLKDNHSILNDLIFLIQEHCSLYTKELDIKSFNKVNNIWININGYKDYNQIHCHPKCLISGVYYVKTPEDCGNIYFQHPSYNNFQYDWKAEKTNNFNSYNSVEWWMPSSAGLLYLFPSWLNHCVKPNLNKKEKRISISFNLL